MKFYQVKGNTWALALGETMPVYRLDERRAILFDTGYPNERGKLEEALAENQLELSAVVCSHAHVDHVGSGEYFRKKYQIPLYISQSEGGILCNHLNMKAYRVAITPKETLEEMGDTLSSEATLIPTGRESVEICGEVFHIRHTPGHSSEHLCFITPDGVCYLGDALLSQDHMNSKFPYALDVANTLKSHDLINTFDYDHYILAHNGDFPPHLLNFLVEENKNLFRTRAEEIKNCCGEGKTIDKLTLDLCKEYGLSVRKASRIIMFQRTIRFFLEYLLDEGLVSMEMDNNGLIYRKL